MAGAPGHALARMHGQHVAAGRVIRCDPLAAVDARLGRVEVEIAAFREAIERQGEAVAALSALVLQRLQAREQPPLRRHGLGRGLAALLPADHAAAAETSQSGGGTAPSQPAAQLATG